MSKDCREEAEGVNELALTAERDRLGVLLSELHAMVVGECNALLDEDRGGNSRLALAIEDALEAWRKR